MKRLSIILILLLLCCSAALPASAQQRHDLLGRVVGSDDKAPVANAVVELPNLGLWAVADDDGRFAIKGVPDGEQRLTCSCLGYVPAEQKVKIPAEGGVTILLKENSLKLDDVVVTAREHAGSLSTSRTIGSNALDHLQMVNASDISSLLPGGKTVNPDLTQDNPIVLRGGGSTVGNAAFGTAVEVDGVRLSTNGLLGAMQGASTRNVATTNIDEVEVVTGVPSAEYGDIGSGVVRISTRKGRTPWTVQMSTNPRTKEISLAKGFDAGAKGGIVNASAEYVRATKNPVSPYTSYSRTGMSLNYSNTFANVLRFNVGVTGNIGGMNSKDDPDAFKGAWSREHDNAVRGNMSLQWLLNKSWITDVELNGSVNYSDDLLRERTYHSESTQQPAVHSEQQGYFLTTMLPETFHTVRGVDSKQLDYAATLKAKWIRSWNGGRTLSNLKAGVAWRAEGNVGEGEYYENPELAPNGYRPYPYTEIPYMHNVAYWIEETFTLPVGSTSLTMMAGLRGESTFIKNSRYRNTSTWSPRLNARWRLSDHFTIRGGWGLVEKLPSLGVLYPHPLYKDVRVFDTAMADGRSAYIFYTHPAAMLYNENLRWQRNRNAEVGVEAAFAGVRLSVTGYFNRTRFPFETRTEYKPASYNIYTVPAEVPDGMGNMIPYAIPANPLLKVDRQTGEIFIRDADNLSGGWVAMHHAGVNKTFTPTLRPDNGSAVDRSGVEMTVDFPTIKPIRTELRLDAAYNAVKYINKGEAWYYPSVSGTNGNAMYQYVGIYADNGANASVTYNGRKSRSLDMNLTSTTHIPSIRMIVTLRLEASLVSRTQNLSLYGNAPYAYNVDENNNPTGGNIYDGNSYTAIRPLRYMDTDGVIHPFTDEDAADPRFANLMLRSGNIYQYNRDGYDPYFSANLSITKEIGDHASISFYANNFTNSRRHVTSYATGTKVILTPGFYYGLTLRLKF